MSISVATLGHPLRLTLHPYDSLNIQRFDGGKNMRILFLNQYYIPDVAATGQLLADVAEELAAQGHEAHVICSRRTYCGGA